MKKVKANSDRCPACRRLLMNHPGLFPTCRELVKLRKCVRLYLFERTLLSERATRLALKKLEECVK